MARTTNPSPSPNPTTTTTWSHPLASGWSFRRVTTPPVPPEPWLPATVPGCVHTDLFASGKIADPFVRLNEQDQQWIEHEAWEYRTTFAVPPEQAARERVELVFAGIDTHATVFLNGVAVLSANDMFRGFRVDVKPLLRAGDNLLLVRFQSPIAAAKPAYDAAGYQLPAANDQAKEMVSMWSRKAPYHYGWDWGPRFVTSGLWRPVTLEAWDTVRIADLQVFQERLDDAEAVLRVKVRLTPARIDRAPTARVRVRVSAALHASQQFDAGPAGAAAAGAAGAGGASAARSSAAVPAVAVRVAETEIEAPVVAGGGDVTLGLRIPHPERWWPNGLGPQRLYDISASVRPATVAVAGAAHHPAGHAPANPPGPGSAGDPADSSAPLDRRTTRIGLRTLEVVHRRDAEGKSFTIEVNGAPVFMKGANWVPADSFLPRIPAERQRWLLESAAAANMNMVRVWGGGVYEDDRFYADCDELGLLVWQDFMFACSMYPGDAAFLDEVRHEAVENVRRLRNHPSLALWAGNNEIEAAWQGWGWPSKFNLSPAVQDKLWKDYRTLFHQLLPAIVAEEDPGRFYTRSSPSANEDDVHANQLGWGDMHYWGVWHAEKPYTDYASNTSRFMSEYGFQSFPELATVALYAAPSDWDIDGPVMLAHQRHPRGNALIRTYLARDFRRPRDFASFLYVGQVLQATIIQYAAEAHRRRMGRNWGSLYWQLDDCWPVASWSGIDYVGRWKALHYAARRFFAPVLVSVAEEGDEIRFWGISDRRTELPAELTVRLVELSGRELWRRQELVRLGANQSRIYLSIPKREALAAADPARVVLVAELAARGERTSRAVFSFVKVKELELPDPGVSLAVAAAGPNLFDVTVRAERFARAVVLSMTDPASGRMAIDGFFDDNAFDLLPGETVTVHLRTRPASTPSGTPAGIAGTTAEAVAPTPEQVRAALRVMSIADSYAR